jgi:hypothetical protein
LAQLFGGETEVVHQLGGSSAGAQVHARKGAAGRVVLR